MEDFSFFRLGFFGTTIIHSLAVPLYMVACLYVYSVAFGRMFKFCYL